jgi:hypothetical protein
MLFGGFPGNLTMPLFDIAIAETELDIQPDTVADDLGWKTGILVAVVGCWCVHAASMPHLTAARQVDNARQRRLSKDDERKVQTSEMLLQLAMIQLMVRRLASRIG